MSRTANKTFLCILLLIFTVDLPAEVYRWVDEQGQVHYEDRSKSQSDSGVSSYKPPTAAAENSQQRLEKTRKLLNDYKVERQQEREQKEKKKQQREKRKRNCAIARDDLRQYQSYGGIYRLNKEGDREYLAETERRKLLQRSRDAVAKWCS